MRRPTNRIAALPGLLLIAALACPPGALAQQADEAAAEAEQQVADEAEQQVADEAESTDEAADAASEPPPTPQPARRRREHTTWEKIYDATVLRPFDFLGLCVSSVAFVPVAILASPSGSYEIETALDLLVIEPAENVFERDLGDF